MSPEDALKMQIECYRRMTPGQRLRIALELHEVACSMSRAGIRSQRPQATDHEVDAELKRRLQMGWR